MPREKVVDRYFMEHRAKLLDVAAFLDRVERSEAPADADDDFRVEALQRAIALLIDERPEEVTDFTREFLGSVRQRDGEA